MKTSLSRRLDVVPITTIETTEVEWIWYPFIPQGRITLLEGDPESGKTYVALAIAAAVTTGTLIDALIPVEGEPAVSSKPGNVLYCSAEDAVADTIRPRFEKVGGDLSRFFAVSGIVDSRGGKDHYSSLRLTDIHELEETLKELKPKLVVFDPLQAFLGAKVDMHRANEVRPVLSDLGQLAERNGCAIILIRHLNKTVQPNALYRGMGSIDVTAAARSVILAGKNPQTQQEGQCVLVHLKSSLGRKGGAMAYSITDDGLSWDGPVDLSAGDLLVPPARTPGPRADAVAFLNEFLWDGPKLASDIYAAAESRGIRTRTLDRATGQMGIVKRPSAFKGPWIWELSPAPERDLLHPNRQPTVLPKEVDRQPKSA